MRSRATPWFRQDWPPVLDVKDSALRLADAADDLYREVALELVANHASGRPFIEHGDALQVLNSISIRLRSSAEPHRLVGFYVNGGVSVPIYRSLMMAEGF